MANAESEAPIETMAKVFQVHLLATNAPLEVVSILHNYFIAQVPMTIIWDEQITNITEEKKRKIAEIIYGAPEFDNVSRRTSRHLAEKRQKMDLKPLPNEIWDVIFDHTLDGAFPFLGSQPKIVCKNWHQSYKRVINKRIEYLQKDEEARMKRISYILTYFLFEWEIFVSMRLEFPNGSYISLSKTGIHYDDLPAIKKAIGKMVVTKALGWEWGECSFGGEGFSYGYSSMSAHLVVFVSKLLSMEATYTFERSGRDGNIESDKLLGMSINQSKTFTSKDFKEATKSKEFLLTLISDREPGKKVRWA